jgi:hypothetical protein
MKRRNAMRAFWLTLLAAGLLALTIDTYEASQGDTSGAAPCMMDDGSGYPSPAPAPTPK